MLTVIKGIGQKTKEKLNSLGIFTPYDLMLTLPKSYIDMTKQTPPAQTKEGCYCKLDIIFTRMDKPFRKGGLSIFKTVAKTKDNEKVNIVWFNQRYISDVINKDDIFTIFGKISHSGEGYSFTNPQIEKKDDLNSKFKGIQPVYRTKGLIPQRNFWQYVKESLNLINESVISREREREFGLMNYKDAIFQIHCPSDMLIIEKAKKRIILEKLVKKMAAFKLEKLETQAVNKSSVYDKNIGIEDFIKALPFELSLSQKNTIDALIEKMSSPHPLNAILCGDVGSGKTAVAFSLIYFAIKNGYQSAFMAPTEILAKQHFEKVKNTLCPLGVRAELLTSSTDNNKKQQIYDDIKNNKLDLIIGTHALINKALEFSRIAFAVLDEQHRFGVAQRTAFIEKGKNCDVLTLTATPIPRTLRLTLFGDIDVFNIEKRYQKNISTHIVTKNKLQDMFSFIAERCKEGEKAFIVVSKIEDDEGSNLNSVQALYKQLSKGVFKNIKTECLHGRLKDVTKNAIMKRFIDGKTSVIIATTVIEVGIDVEDAGIMVIMDAENFGLAALHQLRGRVGRKGQKAYCFLYTEKDATERLNAIVENEDGFIIAEKDFEIRGGGDFLGIEQSGKTDQNIDIKDIMLARKIADKLDVKALKKKLKGEAERNQLKKVSLT